MHLTQVFANLTPTPMYSPTAPTHFYANTPTYVHQHQGLHTYNSIFIYTRATLLMYTLNAINVRAFETLYTCFHWIYLISNSDVHKHKYTQIKLMNNKCTRKQRYKGLH